PRSGRASLSGVRGRLAVFSLSFVSSSAFLDVRLPSQWIVGNGQLSLAKPFDLVPQACRFLELEVGRSLAHTFFEICDNGLQIVPNVDLAFFGQSNVHGEVIALVYGGHHIGD